MATAGALLGGEIVVDDFDDGDLLARPGLSWMAITDELLGGPSRAGVRWEDGSEAAHGVLALEGDQGAPGAGFPVTFLGAWTALAGDGSPRDLSLYTVVRVRARAAEGRFLVGFRRAGQNVSFMSPLPIGAEWAEVVLPLDSLRPLAPPGVAAEWQATDLAWVGFSSVGGQAGHFRLEVDEIAVGGGPDRELAPAASEDYAGFRSTTTQLVDAAALDGLRWTVLTEEAVGDASRTGLPDATALAWAAGRGETVWFRVTLASAPPEEWFGINVALDLDGDPENGMAWWGANSGFRFDRLITAFLNLGAGEWQGALGISDHEAVARGDMASVTREVQVAIDRRGHALLVGVPAASLPAEHPVRLIATVGSSMVNSDDLPNQGAAIVTFGAPTGRPGV
jgi:hypothetical protein